MRIIDPGHEYAFAMLDSKGEEEQLQNIKIQLENRKRVFS